MHVLRVMMCGKISNKYGIPSFKRTQAKKIITIYMQFSGKDLRYITKSPTSNANFLALIRLCTQHAYLNLIILLFVLIIVTCETAYVTACSGIQQPPITAFEEYVPHY